MKKVLLILLLMVLAAACYFGYQYYQTQKLLRSITSFEDCRQANFPVLTSYPPTCKTPDGRSFTQNIGNALELRNEIIVESPPPGLMLMSAFPVRGKARGSWYFEGQFSGELVDANHKRLGTVILKAKDSWMTSDFVPFTGQLIFEAPSTKTGTLILHNANPSGLPEKDKALNIPVIF